MDFRVLSKENEAIELLAFHREIALFEKIEIVNKNSCVFVYSRFPLSRLGPVVGFLDLLREVSRII